MIRDFIARQFKVSVQDMRSKSRKKTVAFPRQVSMYLIRELTDLSLPEIGRFFGAKHHTTILYATKKIKGDLRSNKKLKLIVDSLAQEIKTL